MASPSLSIFDDRQALTSDYRANNSESILAVTGFFMALTVLIMAARMFVRIHMLQNVGPDDWLMLGSVICGIGVFVCFVGEVHNGLGTHFSTITEASYIKLLHWQFFHAVIVTVGISLTKISIAFFLYRLTPYVGMKRFLIGMIIFLIAFTFSSAGTIIFACVPVAGNWDFTMKAKCFSNSTFSAIGTFNSSMTPITLLISFTGINIATDILFATLPIPMIWNLQVNLRMKLTLISILSLGYLACTASIVKLTIQIHFFEIKDYTWKDAYYIWNSIEHYIGILAASLPSLRPLFAKLLETTSKALGSSGLRSRQPAGRYYVHESGIRLGSISQENRDDGTYNVHVTGSGVRRAKDMDSIGDVANRSGSEETILPLGPKGGIVRTTEINVS